MKMNLAMIKRITAILIFLTGFVFAVLGLFGVNVAVNQADVNNIIFGLGVVVGFLIEFWPTIQKLIKDKDFRELMSIVNDVVYAVEESSQGLTGEEKMEKALTAIQTICEERDIAFDKEKVMDMIESVIAIYNTVMKPKT